LSSATVQRRLVGLDVDRSDGCDTLGREIVALQGELDQLDDLLGFRAALAADADDQRLRVINEAAVDLEILLGDQHLHLTHRGNRVAGLGDPRGVAVDGDLGADQQRHHRGFGVVARVELPAGRRLVEAAAELAVRRRGERRVGAEVFGEPAGKLVGAVVAAKQRDDGLAVLANGEHRRLLGLVAQVRRKQADEDPRRADADDGRLLVEEPRQQGLRVLAVVSAVMHAPAGGRRDAKRQLRAARTECNDGGYHSPCPRDPQASSPR
jgi:hypothetical protein